MTNHIIEKIGEFEFNVTTKRDANGALLWNNEIEQKYNEWLLEIFSKNKEVFTIQKISIPPVVMEVINGIIKSNPGCDRSSVIRAMVRVYLDRVDSNEKLRHKIEEFYNQPEFKAEIAETFGVETVKVRFMPKGYIDIKAYAELYDLKPKEVIENILYRIASCFHKVKIISEETSNYLAA